MSAPPSQRAIGREEVLSMLDALSEEVREFSSTYIERIPVPSPVTFLREYVQQNRPVIITGSVDHWPAMRHWRTDEYFSEKAGETLVSVNVTPDGLGDSVKEVAAADGTGGTRRMFVMPEERRMPLREFLAFRRETAQSPGSPIPYVSAQNNSLLDEFPSLAGDVDEHLEWASEALGARPDAVNLWCGDERAATSFHKDHYENLYCVVTGQKVFTLLPPCEGWRLYPAPAAAGRFAERPGGGGFEVVPEEPEREVSWSQVDPSPPASSAAAHREAFPLFWSGRPPLVAEVGPGETLYLPALWHHHVAQRPLPGTGNDRVLAVNFWYDMAFDARFSYFGLVERLARAAGLHEPPEGQKPQLVRAVAVGS